MGTMLSIKPLLHVDNEGHLVPVEKIRSNKKVVDRMLQIFHDTILLPFDGESEQVIFISHADNQEAAEKLADIVRERRLESDGSPQLLGLTAEQGLWLSFLWRITDNCKIL